MPDPLAARKLLRDYGVRPRKSLGQNFIIDRGALDHILWAAEVRDDETVLEIGAGLGALTRELSAAAQHVTATELDQRLLPILKEVLAGSTNVNLVPGDALAMEIDLPEHYAIVANIPYTITSALLRRFLESERAPSRMVLTVQSEVADRCAAAPGDMSLLAISVQIYGVPEKLAKIPPSAFYPSPEVNSRILRIAMREAPLVKAEWIEPVFRLAHAGFAQRRKKLKNSLGSVLGPEAEDLLMAVEVDPSARAQVLSVEQWEAIAKVAAKRLN